MAGKYKINLLLLGSSLGAIIFVLSVSSILLYLTTTDLLNQVTQQSDRDGIYQVHENVLLKTKELERFLETVASDAEILEMTRSLLEDHGKLRDTTEIRKQFDDFSKLLTLRLYIFGSIQNIIVVTDEFSVAVNRSWKIEPGLYSDSPFEEMLKATNADVIRIEAPATQYLSELVYPSGGSADEKTIYITRLKAAGGTAGAVIFVMNANWLKTAVGNDKSVVVYTDDGVCLYAVNDRMRHMFDTLCAGHNGQYEYFREDYEGIDYGITSYNIGGYRLAYFTNISEYARYISEIRNNVILFVLIITALSILVLNLFSRRITRDYRRLIEDVTGFSPGKGPEDRKPYRRHSLKSALIWYFLVILALPALMFQVSAYLRLPQLIDLGIRQRNTEMIKKQFFKIENLSAINTSALLSLALSQDVQDILFGTFDVTGDNVFLRNAYTFDNNFDTNIYSLGGELKLYTSYYNINEAFVSDLEYYRPFSSGVWVFTNKSKLNRPLVSYSGVIMKIIDGEYSLVPAGFIELVYQARIFDEVLDSLAVMGMEGYLLNENNEIIYHKDAARIGSVADTQDLLISESKTLPLKLAAVKSDRYDAEIFASYFKAGAPMLLVVLALILILSYLASRIVNRSVYKIIGQIEQTGSSTGALAHESHIYEIDRIYGAFFAMSKRIDDLIQNEYLAKLREEKLSSEKSGAELAALQAQINPHFLYNTLESIKWLIRGGDAGKAETILNALGNLFRYSINLSQPLATLRSELESVRNYLEIQRIRVNKPISFTIDAPEEALEANVVRMTLQPLIENAIQHGIMKKRSAGKIAVTVERDAGQLLIHIADDGAGFKPGQLERVNQALQNEDPGSERHVGLNNVHRRIRLYFGEAYGLKISFNPAGETVVTLTQPYTENHTEAGAGAIP